VDYNEPPCNPSGQRFHQVQQRKESAEKSKSTRQYSSPSPRTNTSKPSRGIIVPSTPLRSRPTQKLAVSVSHDKTIKIWDAAMGVCTQNSLLVAVSCVTLTPEIQGVGFQSLYGQECVYCSVRGVWQYVETDPGLSPVYPAVLTNPYLFKRTHLHISLSGLAAR